MKPKEYIDKYNLSSAKYFDRTGFISDIKYDFDQELKKCKGLQSIKGYDQCVRVLRQKWDSINAKTVNALSEKMWKYLYASYIAKMRDEFFADEMDKRKAEKERRKAEWEERKRFYEEELGYGWQKKHFEDFCNSFFNSFYNSKYLPNDSFSLLEIPTTASIDEVNSAYRRLSLKHHPDKGGNAKMFIAITEAKENCLKYLQR